MTPAWTFLTQTTPNDFTLMGRMVAPTREVTCVGRSRILGEDVQVTQVRPALEDFLLDLDGLDDEDADLGVHDHRVGRDVLARRVATRERRLGASELQLPVGAGHGPALELLDAGHGRRSDLDQLTAPRLDDLDEGLQVAHVRSSGCGLAGEDLLLHGHRLEQPIHAHRVHLERRSRLGVDEAAPSAAVGAGRLQA